MSTRASLAVAAVGVLAALNGWAQSAAPDEVERETFTAEQLVNWVWEHNPGIAERGAAIDVAVHRIEPAGSLADPGFSYSFAPRTFGREGQGLNQKIEFGQEIPWPGTLKARRAAATYRATAARADEHALRLELAALAKSAFAELYFVQQALEIHHDTHKLLAELKSVADARYAAGKTSQQDALQAEFGLAQLDRHLLELTRTETAVKAQINGLLNRAPAMSLPRAGQIAVTRNIPSLAALERMARDAHPELRRLDAQIAAHRSDVTLAEKAFYPDVRFIAGYNSLWDEADKRPVVGLSFDIPLDRGRRREALLGAKASVRRVESQRANETAQLLADLAGARAGAIESLDSVELHERSLLPLATEFLNAALADYESGSGGFLSVITAEQQLLRTEQNLERSRADVLRRTADLERLAGARFPLRDPAGKGVRQ